MSELISVPSKLDSMSADLWPENILISFLFDKKSFPQNEALIIDVNHVMWLVNDNSASTICLQSEGAFENLTHSFLGIIFFVFFLDFSEFSNTVSKEKVANLTVWWPGIQRRGRIENFRYHENSQRQNGREENQKGQSKKTGLHAWNSIYFMYTGWTVSK